MPTLKDFGGFRIRMFFQDHNPPHVHVIGPHFNALVAIADAAIFRGEIPRAFRTEAIAWIVANRQELAAKWTELQG